MDSTSSEDACEIPKENTAAKLYRAAEISMYVNSITIGPNKSPDISTIEDMNKENKQQNNGKSNKSPRVDNQQVIVERLNKLDLNDINTFRQNIYEQQREKLIEAQARKELEKKRSEEIQVYAKIKSNIEKMKEEAERKHLLKMQELENQIKIAMESERQKELEYKAQREALASNTKKNQEENERQLREQIKKFDDVFLKQEAAFLKILQSCSPEMAPSVDSFSKQLKEIKNFKDTQKNSLKGTKTVCLKLDSLCQLLQKEIKEYEAMVQAKKAQKEAEEKLNAQKHEVIVPKQIVAVQPRSHDQTDQIAVIGTNQSDACSRMYSESRQLLAVKKEKTKSLDEPPELQPLRFALKLVINNSVNLLNEKNRTTLIEGYQKLFNLLSGQRVTTSKGSISIADHNEASDWCRLRIAEKLIDRCFKEPGIVFYVASLTIALWQKFPDFGEIFKASLFLECPFLIPFMPPKLKNQSNEELMTSWGYRIVDGVFEKHDHYENRTTKFAALLAALWISFPRKDETQPSPFDISCAWKYLANVLNTRPDVYYLHIIGKILENCGFMLYQLYGKQFIKVMIVIRDKYIPTVQSSIDEVTSASFNRLKECVGKFFTERKFEEPKGRVTLGYW